MKKYYIVGWVVLLLTLLHSCSLPRQSAVISKDIKLGMTKQEVEKLLGIPYKKATGKDANGEENDILYFKERVFYPNGSLAAFHVESILNFKDDILISIEQKDQTYAGCTTVGCSCQ